MHMQIVLHRDACYLVLTVSSILVRVRPNCNCCLFLQSVWLDCCIRLLCCRDCCPLSKRILQNMCSKLTD